MAIEQFKALTIALVAVGIVLVVGFLIIAETKSTMETGEYGCDNQSNWFNTTSNLCCTHAPPAADIVPGCIEGAANSTGLSHAWNGTQTTQSSLGTIPNWLSIIVLTVIGAALIGLVALFGRRR